MWKAGKGIDISNFKIKSIDEITDYHAHVYYTAETHAQAAHLRQHIKQLFDVRIGQWHEQESVIIVLVSLEITHRRA